MKKIIKTNDDGSYHLLNYIGTGLYVLVIIFGITGIITRRNLFLHIAAYILILIGVYSIALYIYFKKTPILKGISDKSKIAVVGEFILSALLFYTAYWILIHFP